MEDLVVSARYFNGYIVKYPMGSHLDFVATSYPALVAGIKKISYGYKPKIYALDTWYTKPKLRLLTAAQMKTIFNEAGKK